jgi:hypothetical protein
VLVVLGNVVGVVTVVGGVVTSGGTVATGVVLVVGVVVIRVVGVATKVEGSVSSVWAGVGAETGGGVSVGHELHITGHPTRTWKPITGSLHLP